MILVCSFCLLISFAVSDDVTLSIYFLKNDNDEYQHLKFLGLPRWQFLLELLLLMVIDMTSCLRAFRVCFSFLLARFPFCLNRYKGISIVVEVMTHALGGQFVSFGIFKVFPDNSLSSALGEILKLIASVPMFDLLVGRYAVSMVLASMGWCMLA